MSLSLGSGLKRLGRWSMSRGGIFCVEILYLAALWVLAALYVTGEVVHPRHTLGDMPVPVPWFGALGAVLLSLTGTFEHMHDWNPRYAQWHWARPFVGASFAVVSVLIMQAGILSVGSDPHQAGKSSLLYYIVAFVVGYREETFRELVKRLVDVLLAPGATGTDPAPTIKSVAPATGPKAGGTAVVVEGAGFVKVLTVKFGDNPATSVTVESPTKLTVLSPAAADSGAAPISVATKAGTATAAFTYTE